VYENVNVPDWIRNRNDLYSVYIFAREAHEFRTEDGKPQYRKFSNETLPYITHPLAVASILFNRKVGDSNMWKAAILHDVVEDTLVELPEIRENFGDDIAYLVEGMTKKSMGSPELRAHRKAMDRDAYATYCERVQTVKVADIMHNTYSASTDGSYTWSIMWLNEALDLLGALMLADSELRDRAISLVKTAIDLRMDIEKE